MPKQTPSQTIGRQGERWFLHRLPTDWILQCPSEDVGIDGVVVVGEDGELHGYEFRVQVKSSSAWVSDSTATSLPGIKRSSIRYWAASSTPTMLVLYGATTDTGAYCWLHDLLEDDPDLLTDSSDTTSLRVPLRQWNASIAWDDVRQELRHYYGSLRGSLWAARHAGVIIDTIHALHECLRGFHVAATALPKSGERTEEQEKLLARLELTCHRDAVLAFQTLHKQLEPDCEGAQRLAAITAGYIAYCDTFFRPFDRFVRTIGLEDQYLYAHELMVRARPKLFGCVLDVLRMLSGIRKKPENEDEPNVA